MPKGKTVIQNAEKTLIQAKADFEIIYKVLDFMNLK